MTAPHCARLASRRRLVGGRACLAVLALGLGGCGTLRKKIKTPIQPTPPATYVAPAATGIGRVLSPDVGPGVALVELFTFGSLPPDLAGRALIARDPATLVPTAKLVASKRRSGLVLGVYVVEGTPSIDDEVALLPIAKE